MLSSLMSVNGNSRINVPSSCIVVRCCGCHNSRDTHRARSAEKRNLAQLTLDPANIPYPYPTNPSSSFLAMALLGLASTVTAWMASMANERIAFCLWHQAPRYQLPR